MFRLLYQPYPTEESVRRRLAKAIAIAAFIGFFLLVFQPFGLDDWQTPAKTFKILGFGGVTLAVMLANYFILPTLLPRFFSDDRWTVGKEIVRVLSFITVIALGNRLYLGWLMHIPLAMGGWLWSIGITFLVGLFPTTGLILFHYITQLKKYSRGAEELPVPMHQSDAGSPAHLPGPVYVTVQLVADNDKDKLEIPARDLLFIESADNYCTIHFLNHAGQVTKRLFRSSLSRLVGQINQPHIVRCHRSFVVNLNQVERVSGNAQGYKLHVMGGQFQIPVARQYNETLVAELKSL